MMDTQRVVSSPPGCAQGPDYPSELQSRAEEIRQDPAAIPSQVESAYVPSGVAPPGSAWRVILGAALGVPLGYVAAAAWAAIIFLLSSLLGRVCYVQLALLAMTLVLPFVPAAVVGWMAGRGSKWGKSRKPSLAGWTAVAVAFVGDVLPILALAGMAMTDSPSIQRAAGRQIAAQNVLIGAGLLAVFAAISLVVAYNLARNSVKARKFCEECQEYMESRQLSAWPLRRTGQAVLHLLDWNLDDLAQIPKVEGNAEDRCEMDLWTCGCHHSNYLDLTTQGKIGKKNYGGRLVYSAYLNPEQVALIGSTLGVEPYVTSPAG